MDYQLNVFSSSEKELLDLKASGKNKNRDRIVKTIYEVKPKELYRRKFSAAVKKYNEYALSGRIIDNYYESIKASNIPELYQIDVIVRYDIANKNEEQIISKSFSAFQKALEKDLTMAISGVYLISYDDFKELLVFFVPISEGYPTDLSVRNDLIDVVRKQNGIKDNINVIKAMNLFVKYIDELWRENSDTAIASQEELERQARARGDNDPMSVHSIAVNLLKEHMNGFQKIARENDELRASIEKEKTRIGDDIEWVKVKTEEILVAEVKRQEEERRLEEERKRAEEEARRQAELERERKKAAEEAHQAEAKRLAEIAKKNLEMRESLAREAGFLDSKTDDERAAISSDLFLFLVQKHNEWMKQYNVTSERDVAALPKEALGDKRRMNLKSADIKNVDMPKDSVLVGASFRMCRFVKCVFSGRLISSRVDNCEFQYCKIKDLVIKSCKIVNTKVTLSEFFGVIISNTSVEKSEVRGCPLSQISSAESNVYKEVSFADSGFKNGEMMKNKFLYCDFTNAKFIQCDATESVFVKCNTAGALKANSKINF